MIINIFILLMSLNIFAEVTDLNSTPNQALSDRNHVSPHMQKQLQALRFIPTKKTLSNGQSCPGKELGYAQIIFQTDDILSIVSTNTNLKDGDKIIDVSVYGITTRFALNNSPKEKSNSDISSHTPQCYTKQSLTASRVGTFIIQSEMVLTKSCKNKPDLVTKRSMTLTRKRSGRWKLNISLNPDDHGNNVTCQYTSKK